MVGGRTPAIEPSKKLPRRTRHEWSSMTFFVQGIIFFSKFLLASTIGLQFSFERVDCTCVSFIFPSSCFTSLIVNISFSTACLLSLQLFLPAATPPELFAHLAVHPFSCFHSISTRAEPHEMFAHLAVHLFVRTCFPPAAFFLVESIVHLILQVVADRRPHCIYASRLEQTLQFLSLLQC